MQRKHLGFLAVAAVLGGMLVLLAVTLSMSLSGAQVAAEPVDATQNAATLRPVAIGALPQAGTHLVPPRTDVLMAELFKGGDLPLDATPDQIRAAQEAWYRRFEKRTRTWVNPQFQEWAQQREAQLAAGAVGPLAIQPVTATVFAMAVDFGATETFTIPVDVDGECVTQTVTITGPLNGVMAPPPSTDNFTLWYSPSKTSDAKFYEKIIFGYEGAGRARYDLTDPEDGQPGINLAGLTVQDYFDNVAGDDNVYITGSVEGWVTVNHSEGYYGANNCQTGNDGFIAPVAQLVVDAAKVFSATNPAYFTDTGPDAFWPKYDANEDGVVDTFWVIHGGAGEEADGGEQGDFAIWSHSSDIRHSAQWEDGFKVYEGDPLTTTDDIIVGPYTMQPENAETGVFAEEFGHNFFGLPDLYTTDASNSIGDWAIMSGGAWMGWLGGTRPASMPLWFKMIAAFDDGGSIKPVNWQEPMAVRGYDDAAADVTIGQLEKTPDGVLKGVQVNLPTYTLSIDNKAGTGKGAYSGTGRDETDAMLEMQVTVGAATTGTLTIDAYWEIEEDWDYGYVMINGAPMADMDGVTTNYNPNSNNLGNGLTGSGDGTLRFDLSAYAGQIVTLTLRYKTDAAVTEDGWWVDNVALDDTPIDDFEGATAPGTFPGWTNSDPGWLVVPTIGTYERYYVVEWRTMTKYDQMIAKSAYIHNYTGGPEGDVVSRIPYNMPAALVYYRDTQYGATYAMHGNASDPPSYGSKYQLLIVDQNWEPTRIFSDTEYLGYWTGRISSYDAGLTLQASEAFTIPAYWGIPDWPGQSYPSKPAVTNYNDTNGYYAGYYFGDPCPAGYVCFGERDGSAVIPARGPYSVRLTDFDGDPVYGLYGIPWSPSWLGSGNPGDDNVQFGVNFDLISKAGDDAYNSTATLRFNSPAIVEFESTAPAKVTIRTPGTYTVTYKTTVENTGVETVTNDVILSYTLDANLGLVSLTEDSGSGPVTLPPTTTWSTDELTPGEVVTLTLVTTGTAALLPVDDSLGTRVDAYDGMTTRGPWFLDTDLAPPTISFLPLIFGKNP